MPQELAPQGQEFFLRDGRRLHSLQDLYDALEHMHDGEFRHLLEGGHFARWIEHALDDKFLASAVRRVHTKAKLQKLLFIALFR